MSNIKIKIVVFFVFISINFISCIVHKSTYNSDSNQVYKWKNQIVSKKKYDRKLYRFTYKFVKNSSKEDLELLKELIVVYDTLPKDKKN